MNKNNFLIIGLVGCLMGCQSSGFSISGSKQEPNRGPAETVTIGNSEESTTPQEHKKFLLEDVKMVADIYIPKGSTLKINDKKEKDSCKIQVKGPKQLLLGDLPDDDAAYSLDYDVPGYMDGAGYKSYAGSSGGGIYLPLDKSQRHAFVRAKSIMDIASFSNGNNTFYKDGKLIFFEIANEDHKYLSEGGKNKPIYITKHTITMDPLAKAISSMTTEIRIGDVYSDVLNFEKMPLKAKTTCSDKNYISQFKKI
jgi:hypothetical protein